MSYILALVPPKRLEHPIPLITVDFLKAIPKEPTTKTATIAVAAKIKNTLIDMQPRHAALYSVSPNLGGNWRARYMYEAYEAGIVDLVQLKLLGGVYAYLAIRRANAPEPR